MSEKNQPGRKSHSSHQPKGLSILYDDRDIIVVNKSSGLLTIGTETEREKTAYSLLTDYVRKGNFHSKNRLFIVHRLDRDTSGVLVFAKNEKAKRFLQEQWQKFSKTYYAVVVGKLEKKEDVIVSYLAENRMHRVYSVKDPAQGKYSKTGYRVVNESDRFSLVEINLFTGSKNQIRVHFSEMGHPVAGDRTYGHPDKTVKRLALHAAKLTFIHPYSKKEMTFKTKIPGFFQELVGVPSKNR